MPAYFESGFFYREPAWHGEGTVVDGKLTTQEAIVTAGLDWSVVDRPVFSVDKDGNPFEVKSHKMLFRDSDDQRLSIASRQWKPLQNKDAFEWFDPFLEQKAAYLESAGSLQDGKRVWILAKIDIDPEEVIPGDRLEPYLLLTNSHVPGEAIGVAFTVVRVVCYNTLHAAIGDADYNKTIVRVRHTGQANGQLEDIRASLDIARRQFGASVTDYKKMANASMSEKEFERYIRAVLAVSEDKKTADIRAWDSLLRCFRNGAGSNLDGVRGTVWAGYNAVTEWTQWKRRGKSDNRLASVWYGDSRRKIQQAHAIALALS